MWNNRTIVLNMRIEVMDKDMLYSCKPFCGAALSCGGGGMNRIFSRAFGNCLRQNLAHLLYNDKAAKILRLLSTLRMAKTFAALFVLTLCLSAPVFAQDTINQKQIIAPDETVSYQDSNLNSFEQQLTEDDLPPVSNQDINVEGGMIYNSGTIEKIENTNISLNALSIEIANQSTNKPKYGLYGALIYNTGDIKDINNATFGGNSISLQLVDTNNWAYVYGGLIYNESNIGLITDTTFSNNYINVSNNSSHAAIYGGLINNAGTIESISADFINNRIVDSTIKGASQVFGGLIYNSGEIGSISGNFENNNTIQQGGSSGYQYNRGLINNAGNIDEINGAFKNNTSTLNINYSAWGSIYGSVILQDAADAYINNITGTFDNNTISVQSLGAVNATGLIAIIQGTVENINISASNNYIYSESLNSYALTQAGVLYLAPKNTSAKSVTGYFTSNKAITHQTPGTIDPQNSDIRTAGGVIVLGSGVLDNLSGVFKDNYAETISYNATWTGLYGGVLKNAGTMSLIENSLFENNKSYVQSQNGETYAFGGVIHNSSVIGDIKNSSFVNNTVEVVSSSDNVSVKGGAIYSTEDLKISADNGISQFSGNKTILNGKEDPNAIFISDNSKKLTLNSVNNGVIKFDDNINGTKGYSASINGDSTGKVILNNDIINANISLDNTNLYLGREDVFNQSQTLTLNSGSIYLNNNITGTMHIPTLNLNGTTNISVDADLANKTMDTITADSYNIKDNAKLNVNNIILLSDAKEDKTSIQFAENPALAQAVQYTGVSPIAYSPIYKYEVGYDPNTGMFTFVRGSSSSGSYDNFNPAVVAPSVATQAGAYTTQIQTFNYAFQHADTFMNIPYLDRLAIINQNKYALSPTSDATDVGTFSPLMTKQEVPGFWIKPYASFENIPLKNGPKVSNINYGTLVGYDSPITSVGHGWERVLTGYIGYNGASQRYSGVDTYQNGGLIGGTTTFYKGNFFNATTLSVGASSGSSSNMYGNENYAMLLAGIGNKTGYNFEFKEGKIILQPSFLISYTFVNTFDYTNSAGLRIESDPLHAIQLAPGIKLIGNLKNGWQPYIGVNMIWNLLQTSKVTANDVRLPEMSIKPYVQYGAGIQKLFNDRFMAYGQAMIHNGGRNGISFSAGFRWKVGKE